MDLATATIFAISMFGNFPCGNTTSLRNDLMLNGPPTQHRIDNHTTASGEIIPVQAQVIWDNHPKKGVYTLYISSAMTLEYDGCQIKTMVLEYETQE